MLWKTMLLKKMYIMSRLKILKIIITNLATNTTLNAKINKVKNKKPSITNLVTNASLKNKIPNITNLATNTALTVVENKIPDHNKYVTTP